MADILHSTLTGADLHESKGAASASLGQVAVANGAGGAPFANLNWNYISNKPSVPSYFVNDVQVTGSSLIKHYTTVPLAGVWTVNLTGFTTIHNVFATCISGGTGLGSDALAVVRTATATSITGSVLVFSGSQTNLGTSQSVRITVVGV